MDILTSIDIALGMIVVYLTFALGVTAANEGLAAALNSRAGWLRRGIASLLTPSTEKGWSSRPASTDGFYASPFVCALGRTRLRRNRFPSSYIPRWTILQGLLDMGRKDTPSPDNLESIREAANKLPERSPARVVILDLLDRAGADMEKFRVLVDEWLGNFEEQVRSWYRRKTQLVLFFISAAVVCIANVDTVAVFRQLSVDGRVRAALVEKALEMKDDPEADKQAIERFKEDPRNLGVDLTNIGLRLGWSEEPLTKKSWESLGELWNHRGELLLKILGLLLSTFAVAMGAPFWFDLLKKVASIRSVGLNLAERARSKKP